MDRGEIIIYQTADGETRLDVRMENDSVWLTQAQIAQLFGTEIPAISKHIRNVFQSGELERAATVSNRLCRAGVLIPGCHPINFRSLLSAVCGNRRRRCS